MINRADLCRGSLSTGQSYLLQIMVSNHDTGLESDRVLQIKFSSNTIFFDYLIFHMCPQKKIRAIFHNLMYFIYQFRVYFRYKLYTQVKDQTFYRKIQHQ